MDWNTYTQQTGISIEEVEDFPCYLCIFFFFLLQKPQDMAKNLIIVSVDRHKFFFLNEITISPTCKEFLPLFCLDGVHFNKSTRGELKFSWDHRMSRFRWEKNKPGNDATNNTTKNMTANVFHLIITWDFFFSFGNCAENIVVTAVAATAAATAAEEVIYPKIGQSTMKKKTPKFYRFIRFLFSIFRFPKTSVCCWITADINRWWLLGKCQYCCMKSMPLPFTKHISFLMCTGHVLFSRIII